MTHLDEIESEAVYAIREVVAQFDNPALLFSGGKDSVVCFHLARKAFYPEPIPFPLVHIDTGHNFPETIAFRDEQVKKYKARLIVGYVEDSIQQGKAIEEVGINASRNLLQTVTLLDTIDHYQFDCCMGGARRDEEKARAKERFFSHRDEFGQWDPKNQRPELWNLFNAKKKAGEHFRVFPISNWTEMDVWQYILQEDIALPSIYFSHERKVFERNGVLYSANEFMARTQEERVKTETVRFRTIGDMTCTGAVPSKASSLTEVIDEVSVTRSMERGSRVDDQRSEAAMEDRKKVGYF